MKRFIVYNRSSSRGGCHTDTLEMHDAENLLSLLDDLGIYDCDECDEEDYTEENVIKDLEERNGDGDFYLVSEIVGDELIPLIE